MSIMHMGSEAKVNDGREDKEEELDEDVDIHICQTPDTDNSITENGAGYI